MERISIGREHANWKQLYRIGGVAPFIVLILYLSQFLIFFSGEAYPLTAVGWFKLFQRSKILGLFFLNALDIFSIAMLGLMYLALCVTLRRTNPSQIVIATFFAFLGVAVFVSSRVAMVSGMLSLSEQYATAVTEAQRSQILAAAQVVTSLSRATPETFGFLFMAIAGLVYSIVILQSKNFSKLIGYLGILAFTFTLANDISLIIAPSVAAFIMPINGSLWLLWWILVGLRLFKFGRMT